ncbi:hypothetical protein SAMN05216516_1207 [Izhakiella capsodis]|uniref:Uncharacterized protein n=1 Tax=Izhakiella capsodis TaxID=1367852 RepID=A0A1I5BPN6_9GAMM|nr:hypothetical protein SAMN05216516_1207 [Izhakiella capsodis]
MPLSEYIAARYGGNQAGFARAMGVNRQQVTKWLNDGWIVSGNWIYSPRRELPKSC